MVTLQRLRRNIQRHLNDLDAAELSMQQQDMHLEHEENCRSIQQIQQLQENSQEITDSVSTC